MNEPQVWTLIGVFAAALIGMVTFTTQVMWRSINGQLQVFREEMKSEFASMRAETVTRFEAVDKQFESMHREMDTRFEAVRQESAAQFAAVRSDMESMRTQITHLDRDVQAISRRVFPSE